MKSDEYEEIQNDTVKFPGDTTLKTNGSDEIYPKLVAFDNATKDYRLPINWKKVHILTKNMIMG